jgi:SAM-dependent methyltransferase
MPDVPGTRGYENSIEAFIQASITLPFEEVCAPFLDFLPSSPARILDAGAGVGQNAAYLARLGHSVVAIEPCIPFLDAARKLFPDLPIVWTRDSLPRLRSFADTSHPFDFILVQGVWHHLTETERTYSLERLGTLLKTGGFCAMSLRNGPPGAGTYVFPIRAEKTMMQAEEFGLRTVLFEANRPSLMKNKPEVTWSFLVFQKGI